MIIETWVAALFCMLLAIICIIGLLGWFTTDQRLDESREENNLLREQNDLLREKIHVLEGKLIVKTATEFYNEGNKKR